MNMEDIVLLIGSDKCLPSQKVYNAKKMGAKYVVVESRVTPPGIQIQVYNIEEEGMFAVYLDCFAFRRIMNEIHNNGSKIIIDLYAGMLYPHTNSSHIDKNLYWASFLHAHA